MSDPSPRRPPEMKTLTRCCVIASRTRRVQVGRMPAAERILGTVPSSAAFVQESFIGTSRRQVGTATLKWGGFIPVFFLLEVHLRRRLCSVPGDFGSSRALITNFCSARN